MSGQCLLLALSGDIHSEAACVGCFLLSGRVHHKTMENFCEPTSFCALLFPLISSLSNDGSFAVTCVSELIAACFHPPDAVYKPMNISTIRWLFHNNLYKRSWSPQGFSKWFWRTSDFFHGATMKWGHWYFWVKCFKEQSEELSGNLEQTFCSRSKSSVIHKECVPK